MKLIKDLWTEYRKVFLPQDLPEEEVLQQKNTFFAAAGFMFLEIKRNAYDHEVSIEDGDKWVSDVTSEINSFMKFLEKHDKPITG